MARQQQVDLGPVEGDLGEANLSRPAGDCQPGQWEREVVPAPQHQSQFGRHATQDGPQAVQGRPTDELVRVVENEPHRDLAGVHDIQERRQKARLRSADRRAECAERGSSR
jgi:hypothetical protein